MKTLLILAAGIILPNWLSPPRDDPSATNGYELYQHIAVTSAKGMEARMSAPTGNFEHFTDDGELIAMVDDPPTDEVEPSAEPSEELDPSGLWTVMVLGSNVCQDISQLATLQVTPACVPTVQVTPQCISQFTHGGYLCDGTFSPGCGVETATPSCYGNFTSHASCTSHALCTSRWCTGDQACTLQDNCTNGLCTTGDRCTVGRDCTAGPSCTNGPHCTEGSSCTALHCTNGSGCTRGVNCTGGVKCTAGANCTTGDCTKNNVCTTGTHCGSITHGGALCTSGQYCTSKFRANCVQTTGSSGSGSLLQRLAGSGSSLCLLAFAAIAGMIVGPRTKAGV